ncbi:putative dTDP-4-dehydrorhamnose reductase [uncultured Desulfobacterium sp.]|uniref:dTDP-4-dehydrorhamnose reductase n=1 Tax=uncultured Desulfobacterium sp. TaxID=201089 RepID=A0A445MVG0_9BACT|nr:putative dTDP-4-dehydrorhamnose reductase [uncultured Desulfobacterium sp.]
MKILITGSTGMLGSECKKVLSEEHQVIAPGKNEMDITNWDGVINNLQKISPDVVLNCAAFTDVDGSEKEDFLVRKINIEGPRNLAQCSARYNCKFVHISSNYVFDGQKNFPQPYFEDDPLNPLSAYGRSKLESEIAVRENSPNYVIVRTACLYGQNGKNFIKAVISHAVHKKTDVLRLADDQIGSPTWAYRLALQIRQILNTEGVGTYHATAEGYCSPFEYAGFITEKLGLKARLEPCKFKDLARPARRPANSLLENRLLKKQGINLMVDWREDVNAFLDTFGDGLIKEAEAKKP